MSEQKLTKYRFSFGPWNIHEGSDPFGPVVREPYSFREKIGFYRELGFEGVQFHDDDAVPNLNDLTHEQIAKKAKEVKKLLDDNGLVAEFVAPRLWEDSRTVDGAYTSNNPDERKYAIERSYRAVDIANELSTDKMVLWLAREGTYIREAKSSKDAVGYILDAINKILAYDKHIKILIEPKPNEPMDHAYVPTIGHAIALAYLSSDPDRVGGLIESAHALLAGLDPSDEMGYALYHNKLWSVHLNDQNGLKFDEDKAFGSNNLRCCFNQVRVLEENGYGRNGEFVGLDVKTMRTQRREVSTKHLLHSRKMFLSLLDKVRTLNKEIERQFIESRDYEGLDFFILEHLMS
ncbi:TIM barrel protein [Candidatus Poribacteria bacterium]|nr:TIM barrel protein [Candidatus Poribacteria bacterium]